MEPRIFHGNITPDQMAQALVGEFSRGNYRVQQFGNGDQVIVQIATRERRRSGGETALSVHLNQVEDGVAVQIGNQAWLGVAASLGETAFRLFRNPWSLLSRLDDLAQDIENLQLSEAVWSTLESSARAAGASFALSERLRRVVCSYCRAANPVGEACCLACGAPLGDAQPTTCPSCGFLVASDERLCPNCGRKL